MTDETTPTAEEPTEDLNYVDPEKSPDKEAIVEKAKKSFKLTDRLKGVKHRHTKVLLFTDLEAVDEYTEQKAKCQALADSVKNQDDLEIRARIEESFNREEEILFAARDAMLQSSLAVSLVAFPNVAVDVAKRAARKRFNDESLGRVPDDKLEDASAFIDAQLFGQTVAKVTDADGDELELPPRDELKKWFAENLPPSQWDRLSNAYTLLTLTDQISESATADPGF